MLLCSQYATQASLGEKMEHLGSSLQTQTTPQSEQQQLANLLEQVESLAYSLGEDLSHEEATHRQLLQQKTKPKPNTGKGVSGSSKGGGDKKKGGGNPNGYEPSNKYGNGDLGEGRPAGRHPVEASIKEFQKLGEIAGLPPNTLPYERDPTGTSSCLALS